LSPELLMGCEGVFASPRLARRESGSTLSATFSKKISMQLAGALNRAHAELQSCARR
jgi:hypothetical protein